MLNDSQKNAFKQEAERLQIEKAKEGYLAVDIVALGYYLIKNNINKVEELEASGLRVNELILRVEQLINELK